MDIELIVISTILVLLIFSPFIWAAASGKQNKKIEKELNKVATQEGSTISIMDSTNTFAIGLGATINKIFFVRIDSSENTLLSIDLNTIKSCEIYEVYKNQDEKSSSKDFPIKTELKLKFRESNKQPITLPFYNESDTKELTNENVLAMKWKNIIVERTNKK